MNYNPEIKEAAYRAYLKGESRKEISLQYNINLHTLCNWTKQWENFSRDEISMEDFGVIATRILALEKEKERLNCELEIIHKSGLLQQLPTSMRVEQVKALSTIYTAKLACRALEIKSATYYARKRHTATAKDKRDNEIRALINKIYEDSHRRFGSEKIRICLRTYGYNVGKKKIIVLMKELGIFQLSNASVVYKVDSLNRLEESSTYVSIL